MLLGFGSCCAIADNLAADKTARIDQLVSRYESCGYLNGAVLVAQHGKILYAKGVGLANMESGTPNTAQTKFDIASLSKQFTALLVLQQAAQGTLRLDGTVSQYLPWYRKDTGTSMTIEQLLHHTAGLPPDYDSREFTRTVAASRQYAPRVFAEKFCQPDLVSAPGTKWAYSNCGYVLLGLILERVSGKPFADLLREQILSPLGMKNTGIDHDDLAQFGGACGYLRHAGPRYTMGPDSQRGHLLAAGGMYSTVEDLFRWNQALSSSEFLPEKLHEEIFKPGMSDWGYGWFVRRIPAGAPGAGSTVAEMRGDMPENFFAWILRYPEQDSVIIVLRNAYGSTEHFEENLQAILFDQRPKLPSRSPKDVLAHAWLVTYASLKDHWVLSLLVVLIVFAFRTVAGRRGSPGRTTPRPSPSF
jgi:CubicO group peptidase (beta-lactamase class C family)